MRSMGHNQQKRKRKEKEIKTKEKKEEKQRRVMDGLLWEIGREKHNHHVLGPSSERQMIQKSSSTLLLVARNPDFLSLISALHVTTRYSASNGQVKVAQVTWLTFFTVHSICSHRSFEGILPTAILPREDKGSAHTFTNSLIPIPLPQHQHTFCQRRCFDQDCPGHRQVEMNKMKSDSFCSFRPDEDQGNPGRNVVSDKKVCWC